MGYLVRQSQEEFGKDLWISRLVLMQKGVVEFIEGGKEVNEYYKGYF